MKFKTTLVLLAVLAVLIAVVLYFDSRGEKEKAAEETTNTLISLTSGDVRKVSLVRNGQPLTFERDEAGPWRLTSPIQASADEYEVDGLVSALTSLRIERVVEKAAKDPEAYEIPKTEVSLWVMGKDAPVRLLVGMENPLDKSLFAKREDDPRIVLLSSSLKTTLDKPVFDFRQKDVFKFTAADVKGIRVKAKNVAWQAQREEAGWSLKAPVTSRTAKGLIDSLLESLAGLRAKAFVAEEKSAATLKEFGLEKPEYEVVLSLPSANQEIVFALHKDGENSYATTSQSAKIITFEGTVLPDLDRKVDEIREKKVVDFYAMDADRIALKRNGVEIAAVKEKSGETEKWMLEGPAKVEADRTKVEDFIRMVEGLEAAEFVDDPGPLAAYGLGPGAEIKIRAKDAGGQAKEIVLLVGTADAAKKLVVVKSPGLGYLFRVDSGLLQLWPADRKDWTAAPPKTEEGRAGKK
ncbi:MAG: DUF4340 domain-containing protein [Candidatus Aminicenantales bacterium]